MLQIIVVQDFCPLKIKITECPSGCRLNNQNNNFARASHFLVHFSAVFALLRRNCIRVLWRTQTSNDEMLFLFLNFDMVSWNSTSGGFVHN